MNRIAIVISSEGSGAEKIANGMGAIFRRASRQADIFNISLAQGPSLTELKSYDGVIIGTPIHLASFPKNLLDWTWDHYNELIKMPTGLFTVSLSAADPRLQARAIDDRRLRNFVRLTDFHPRFVASFAGDLQYSKLNWVQRHLLCLKSAMISGPTDVSRDHDLTDWNDVARFADAYVREDMTSPFATVNRLVWTPEPLWPVGLQRVS